MREINFLSYAEVDLQTALIGLSQVLRDRGINEEDVISIQKSQWEKNKVEDVNVEDVNVIVYAYYWECKTYG